jgi:hypothetical protein
MDASQIAVTRSPQWVSVTSLAAPPPTTLLKVDCQFMYLLVRMYFVPVRTSIHERLVFRFVVLTSQRSQRTCQEELGG